MASGTTLSTLLATLKANAAAIAVAGTVVVGGGVATAAVATGAVHLPGQASTSATPSASATQSAAARQAACMQHNGDATRLAQQYDSKLFGGSTSADESAAQTEICTLFVGVNGRAFGLGEVQQMLDLAVALEAPNANTPKACPLSTSGGVDALLNTEMTDVANGTPIERLASECGASPGGSGATGQPEGTPGAKPTGTPGAEPTETPGKPAETPTPHH